MKRPSHKTEKALFARSGDQCAHPECQRRLTHRAEPCAPTTVLGEVCHIHGKGPGSPRWNPELTAEQIHSSSNLILLCRDHHKIVDDQPDTYTAERLREWKETHESSIAAAAVEPVGPTSYTTPALPFPTSIVDHEVEKTLQIIRRGRFIDGFDASPTLSAVRHSLDNWRVRRCYRHRACPRTAWCARLLARTDELKAAKKYLTRAESLAAPDDVKIAAALIRSHEGDHRTALGALADLNSPMARSASLIVAADQGEQRGAIEWAKDAGIRAPDLDSDGRTFLLAWLLELGEWDAASRVLDSIAADSCEADPALSHLAGSNSTASHRSGRSPTRRSHSSATLHGWSSCSDHSAVRSRRFAARHFRAAASAARSLGCADAADLSEEYALWLDLPGS